jgi:hypothetical protein
MPLSRYRFAKIFEESQMHTQIVLTRKRNTGYVASWQVTFNFYPSRNSRLITAKVSLSLLVEELKDIC